MERITITNQATYTPVALTDVALAAPLASRLLLGSTVPGRVLQAAALGMYAGSAVADWLRRMDVRRIDFLEAFGADGRHLVRMPVAERARETEWLVEEANDRFQPVRLNRQAVARSVNEHLTAFIARVTGQRVETSSELREFTLMRLVFPFALGACDLLSGDVAIFRSAGVFEPHIIAHEFSHRKGYHKELEAQALAYLALIESGDDPLVLSAISERLYRQWNVLSRGDVCRYNALVDDSALRPELRAQFRTAKRAPSTYERSVSAVLLPLYDLRMRLTGQNGLRDYDGGFTDFLYTIGR